MKFRINRIIILQIFLSFFITQFISDRAYSLTVQNKCIQLFSTKNLTSTRHTVKSKKILQAREQVLPDRSATVELLSKFASKHNLPYKWHDFGPEDRKIRRLVVALDITQPELLKEYREIFNLDQQLTNKNKGSGTLVIEQTWENPDQPEHYVYTYIRSSAYGVDPVYRWGRKDYSLDNSFQYLKSHVRNDAGLVGIAHLIELNSKEKDNVKIFLDNGNLRGPCKSANCVAWLTGTELGTTKLEATDAERKYLFSELGISRTIAPFEISRRLTHAANDRHGALIVFVEGEKGLNSFKTEFEKKLIPEPKIPYSSILKNYVTKNPAADAVTHIQDGEKIFIPIAAGASPDAVEALIERSMQLQTGVDLHVLVNGISASTLKKGIETTDNKFRVHALFLGGNMRDLYKENKVTVVPGNLSDFGRMVRDPEQKNFHYDTIIVRVSPANENGFHSLGPNHDMVMTVLRDRPNIKIIAEINPNIPFTKGDNQIHTTQLTASFKSTTELAGPTTVPANEVDQKIGLHIGQLVDSGSSLQIGIGNVFGAVPDGLKASGKTDIKISTEMFGDHMMTMIQNGTVTQAETGFAFGSGNLYKWLHLNEQVHFVSTEYVNSPGRIAQTPKFHAVNTALQVDLFGQVNATMGPDGRISSPGGQVEFMSGAARSEGGKAIIAIRSTAKNEMISTITVKLYDGPITTPHESVTHIVTEYGVAELRGKNEQQRAIALINIAHPKFRKQLFEDAIASNILALEDREKINYEQ